MLEAWDSYVPWVLLAFAIASHTRVSTRLEDAELELHSLRKEVARKLDLILEDGYEFRQSFRRGEK